MRRDPRSKDRRGVAAVEAAAVLPVLLIMLLGIWEVGRIVHVQQVLVNGAREGARLAAGGYTTNSVAVTNAMVQQAVKDYLKSAGLPTTAVNGTQVTLTCLVTPGWTNPSDALPLDKFRVTATIPAGAAFNSLRWSFVAKLTNVTSASATVDWMSLINTKISVDTDLPY